MPISHSLYFPSSLPVSICILFLSTYSRVACSYLNLLTCLSWSLYLFNYPRRRAWGLSRHCKKTILRCLETALLSRKLSNPHTKLSHPNPQELGAAWPRKKLVHLILKLSRPPRRNSHTIVKYTFQILAPYQKFHPFVGLVCIVCAIKYFYPTLKISHPDCRNYPTMFRNRL
jgi:hypothetical protein